MAPGLQYSRVHGFDPVLDKHGLQFYIPNMPYQNQDLSRIHVDRKKQVHAKAPKTLVEKHSLKNKLDMNK